MSFWRNYVQMTSFSRYNNVFITSCVRWDCVSSCIGDYTQFKPWTLRNRDRVLQFSQYWSWTPFFHKIILISVRFGLWSMWFHITFKCIAIGVRNGQETSRFQNQSELSSDRKPGFVQRINTCPCKSLSAPASHQNNRSPLWKEAPFTISHI